jgi:GNAT superfamily N-acetyltransferase
VTKSSSGSPVSFAEIMSDQMASIAPLVYALNPSLSKAVFDLRLQEMMKDGYRCVGGYHEDALIAIAGFKIFTRFWCGKQMDVDNVVVQAEYRQHGVGKNLFAWLEHTAKHEGCDVMVLDSYGHAHAAHRFYHREGFHIEGFHFYKALHPEK